MAVLVVVMVETEPPEIAQLGLAELLDRLVVVDLKTRRDVAALDVALAVHLLDRGAQPCRNRAPEVRHREHVGAVDHHRLQEAVVEQS